MHVVFLFFIFWKKKNQLITGRNFALYFFVLYFSCYIYSCYILPCCVCVFPAAGMKTMNKLWGGGVRISEIGCHRPMLYARPWFIFNLTNAKVSMSVRIRPSKVSVVYFSCCIFRIVTYIVFIWLFLLQFFLITNFSISVLYQSVFKTCCIRSVLY